MLSLALILFFSNIWIKLLGSGVHAKDRLPVADTIRSSCQSMDLDRMKTLDFSVAGPA